VPVAQRTTPFAAGKVWHRRAAKRYVQKLDIGRVHKFSRSVWSWALQNGWTNRDAVWVL